MMKKIMQFTKYPLLCVMWNLIALMNLGSLTVACCTGESASSIASRFALFLMSAYIAVIEFCKNQDDENILYEEFEEE